jgi:Fuc2NAc and GlcNAc transferase
VTAVLATFGLSVALCGVYLRFARSRQLLAVPNERSSHSQPTAHGGGLALVSAFTLGLLLAALMYGTWEPSFLVLAGLALILMVVGVVDDLKGLTVRLRMTLYTLACFWLAATLLPVIGSDTVLRNAALLLLATGAMLWALNLYNFMDGIDGIAALQTVLACCCAAWLSWQTGHGDQYALFCLLLAAAHSGFLVWNCPPARLFMGDAGSVPSGFLLASLVLLGAVQGQLNPLSWLILFAIFVTDATWTLWWRIGTGQAFMQAHRLHAYQRLSRFWGSHGKVDLLLLVINIVWLLPLATAVQQWPNLGMFLVILAYLPLIFGMVNLARLT